MPSAPSSPSSAGPAVAPAFEEPASASRALVVAASIREGERSSEATSVEHPERATTEALADIAAPSAAAAATAIAAFVAASTVSDTAALPLARAAVCPVNRTPRQMHIERIGNVNGPKMQSGCRFVERPIDRELDSDLGRDGLCASTCSPLSFAAGVATTAGSQAAHNRTVPSSEPVSSSDGT